MTARDLVAQRPEGLGLGLEPPRRNLGSDSGETSPRKGRRLT